MRHRDPEFGTIRIRSGFLFFPKRIGKETRWLELAVWAEEWMCDDEWEPVWWEAD